MTKSETNPEGRSIDNVEVWSNGTHKKEPNGPDSIAILQRPVYQNDSLPRLNGIESDVNILMICDEPDTASTPTSNSAAMDYDQSFCGAASNAIENRGNCSSENACSKTDTSSSCLGNQDKYLTHLAKNGNSTGILRSKRTQDDINDTLLSAVFLSSHSVEKDITEACLQGITELCKKLQDKVQSGSEDFSLFSISPQEARNIGSFVVSLVNLQESDCLSRTSIPDSYKPKRQVGKTILPDSIPGMSTVKHRLHLNIEITAAPRFKILFIAHIAWERTKNPGKYGIFAVVSRAFYRFAPYCTVRTRPTCNNTIPSMHGAPRGIVLISRML